ncbi:MAG: lipid-A-disaccharide synthase, partial [Planctomycetaceae bacterium]|nr:lipid-A-disaccharide synthase [Planctomycetaceae bacterium]
DFLTQSIHAMLNDHFYFQGLLESLDRLRDQYAQPGASQRAAEFLHRQLSGVDGMPGESENLRDLSRRAA